MPIQSFIILNPVEAEADLFSFPLHYVKNVSLLRYQNIKKNNIVWKQTAAGGKSGNHCPVGTERVNDFTQHGQTLNNIPSQNIPF